MKFRIPILVLLHGPLMFLPPLAAQPQGLSLQEAVRIALEKHPSVEATAAQVSAAGSRIDAARGGYLPQVNFSESWMRSNNPVFVFGALLTQRQFTEANFAIDRLNRPDFVNNFQSQVVVDQVVYDARQIRSQVRSAELGRSIASQDLRRARMDVIANVVRRYYGFVLARESLAVATEAVKSAEADLVRAEAVRSAGLATDADVLSIRVHVSAMREQQIRRGYDAEVAQAALNEALGLPLETRHDLTTPLTAAPLESLTLDQYEKTALAERPELRQAELARTIAETQVSAARGSLLPRVGLRGMFEADRGQFVRKAGANWLVGATLNWNVFNGNTNRARIQEAGEMLRSARAQETQASRGVRLQVHSAFADFQAAKERIEVASAAVSMAEESLRIIKNRFEAGLTTVTELLRNETALLDARTRRLAAVYDQRVAAAMLERASGTLSVDSGAIR